MTATVLFDAAESSRSVFAGADVCHEAGLRLPERARRVLFDEELWDFTEVIGLPMQMPLVHRRFDFAAIINPRWQLVAKELVLAMLAVRHDAVAPLSRAYRTPLHVNTASGRLVELTRFLNWLTGQGIAHLGEVDADRCEQYLAHRRYVRDENDVVVGERSPATRRAAAQTVVDLVNYRDLFTTDRLAEDLRPWKGATPSAIAEMPNGREQNTTPPLDDTVLTPMLAAATYLVSTLGPHVVALARQLRQIEPIRRSRPEQVDAVLASFEPLERIAALLNQYVRREDPLPQLLDQNIRARLAKGWDPSDPLLALNWDMIARQAGYRRMNRKWIPPLRDAFTDAAASVGIAKSWARQAAAVARAHGDGHLPWTVPLHRIEADAVVGIVRTACIIVIAAVSGMRSSELMELQHGCRRPPEHFGPDQVHHRLASKVVKGQPLGGTADEWVVIEPVYRAAELAEQLLEDPGKDMPLFGRFAFDVRYKWFRDWVNGEAGQRLGLALIPEGKVNLRMLRRTLALELAYRPGGVLATKIHLKHVAVATTEGYAARPGGAQAELLVEVNKHETERNLDLIHSEFRNYQQGIQPAGPGARELIEYFAHIDAKLTPDDATAPKVQRNDREVLNLLSKRAKTLHLGAANYCWFTDPSRALCLKLAGTPNADKPLAGMCDSARCPQATHHQHHRPIWAEHAETTETFLGQLGPTRKIEKTRLRAEYDRATRVLAEIDAADNTDKKTKEEE